MEESSVPLLKKKVYYDDCPGCKIEQRNDERPEVVPYKDFFFMWIVTLCTSLPISSLFPFCISWDLHVAKREEDIGYYAGFVGSAFMCGRVLTSVFWGLVADRYGRKPVILISIFSVVIFNTLFGLSTRFWMAITTRFLLGVFNGLLGPIKAYASEICRKEHQAIGLSLFSTARGIGLIIGPAIGGFLAQPAESYPKLFSKDSIFGRFPYFLPCLCISLFSSVVFFCSFRLPETLHIHRDVKSADGTIEDCEKSLHDSDSKGDTESGEQSGSVAKENLLKNWPLISAIIVYCVFSLQEMAYSEIFSLWAVSDKRFGGLSFSSQQVGEVLAISGFGLLLFQIFLYPYFAKVLGPLLSSRVAAALTIPLLSGYPFMAKLSGVVLFLVVNFASLLKNILSIATVTGMNILQNDAVSQHQRGAANGISIMAMSLFKAVAPASAGTLFSWAQKHQHGTFFPGDQMVFFVLNMVGAVAVLLTFKPFLVQRREKSVS